MSHNEEFFLQHAAASTDPVAFEIQNLGRRSALSDFQIEYDKGFAGEVRSEDISLVKLVSRRTGETIGGICVQFRNDGRGLPTEVNLADPELSQEIARCQPALACEISGAWIAKPYRKRGLLPFLVYGAVAAAHLRGARFNFSSSHDRAAALYEALGVEVDYGRTFFWPDLRYRTHLLRIDILRYMNGSSEHSRHSRAVYENFSEGRIHSVPCVWAVSAGMPLRRRRPPRLLRFAEAWAP